MSESERFREYINWLKEQELSDNTIKAYVNDLSVYVNMQGWEFTKEKIVDFKWKMAELKKPKTVNHYIVALKSFCKFKGIQCDVKKMKIQQLSYVENVMTLEQFNTLIEGLKKDGKEKYAAYISLPAKTGARVSEFLKFTKKDLDRGYAELFTKGKIRTIYFPKKFCDEMKTVFGDLKENELLVRNKYGEPITTSGFRQILKKWAKKYGIPEKVAHPHSLRHLFAKEFIKRNPDISLLADILGHSGVNTTMIYTRNSKEEQIEKLNRTVDW